MERSSYREWEPGEDVVLVVGPAGVDVGDPLVDRRRLVGVPQHLERVLQAGQLGGADHHGDGLAVPRQDQALEGALDLGGEAANVGIAFERHGGHVLVMPRNGGGDEMVDPARATRAWSRSRWTEVATPVVSLSILMALFWSPLASFLTASSFSS